MSDVSDPEDEIVDIGPDPPKVAPASVPQHVPQHGGCQARRPLNQKPPGADRWTSIYTVYLNKNRTKAQVKTNYKTIKWYASSRWSFDTISAWGSIDTTTIGKTHPIYNFKDYKLL